MSHTRKAEHLHDLPHEEVGRREVEGGQVLRFPFPPPPALGDIVRPVRYALDDGKGEEDNDDHVEEDIHEDDGGGEALRDLDVEYALHDRADHRVIPEPVRQALYAHEQMPLRARTGVEVQAEAPLAVVDLVLLLGIDGERARAQQVDGEVRLQVDGVHDAPVLGQQYGDDPGRRRPVGVAQREVEGRAAAVVDGRDGADVPVGEHAQCLLRRAVGAGVVERLMVYICYAVPCERWHDPRAREEEARNGGTKTESYRWKSV